MVAEPKEIVAEGFVTSGFFSSAKRVAKNSFKFFPSASTEIFPCPSGIWTVPIFSVKIKSLSK